MAQAVQIGQVLVDKYRVERVLGEGGMAVVLAARHLQLGQQVAIKVMLPKATELFPDATERFLREARALVRLSSEHTARVMDVGTLGRNTPYLVMEYLEGADLGEVLTRTGPLAVEDACDYVIQACVAMSEAHAQGIVHRDLKPGNLFLTTRPNGRPLIKVLDFGISKVVELSEYHKPTVTQTWGSMGSPPYMSPEQSKSAKYVDARSDIWSLGAILYQLMSGQLPFPGEAAPEIFANILYMPPSPLRDSAPWVPEALEQIILRTLAKEPMERIQSMPELAEALAPFASPHGRSIVESALGVVDITEFTPAPPGYEDEQQLPSVIVKGPDSRHGTPIPPEVSRILEERAKSNIMVMPPPRRSRGRWVVIAFGVLFVAGLVAGVALFDWSGRQDSPIPGAATTPDAATADDGGDAGVAERGDGPDETPPGDPDNDAFAPAGAADAGASQAAGEPADAGASDEGGEDAAGADPAADRDTRAKPRNNRSNRRKRNRRKRNKDDDDDPFGSVGEPAR